MSESISQPLIIERIICRIAGRFAHCRALIYDRDRLVYVEFGVDLEMIDPDHEWILDQFAIGKTESGRSFFHPDPDPPAERIRELVDDWIRCNNNPFTWSDRRKQIGI